MKNMTSCLLAMFVMAVAPVASAVIINVPGDYPTIQEGIDAAQNGDTVLVAPGEYWENPIIEEKNILITSSGGTENTLIRGFFIFEGNIDSTCVLRGFYIFPYLGTESVITIRDCSPIVEGNVVRSGGAVFQMGGGIYARNSAAIIRDNIIRNNAATIGGGIYADTNVAIERCVIADNYVGGSHGGGGGGVCAVNGRICYNLIIDNLAASGGYSPAIGGGITVSSGYDQGIQVYNNTIVGNSAAGYYSDNDGGGLYYSHRDSAESNYLRNNIIAFNENGGGVFSSFSDSGGLIWDYNLVFGNEPYDYDGFEPGPHDIQADPLFVDRFSGDYNLLPNSPCIDAGDPDSPLDPDGTRADIGAYYFDQAVGIEDPGEPSGPYRFQLHQNYPNPFNAQTIISYYLSEESTVSLHIYSITGHFVEALANKEVQTSGEHKYVWDGKDKNDKIVSTGIYFYELYVDDYRESKAMILIK